MPVIIESEEPFVVFITSTSKPQQVESKPVQKSGGAGWSETVYSASISLEDPKGATFQVVPTRFLTAHWKITP
jgi:hypothetical protein